MNTPEIQFHKDLTKLLRKHNFDITLRLPPEDIANALMHHLTGISCALASYADYWCVEDDPEGSDLMKETFEERVAGVFDRLIKEAETREARGL